MDNNLLWAKRHMDRYKRVYRRYRAYYDGDHRFWSTVDPKLSSHELVPMLKELKDNLCKRVVGAKAARLKFTGWDSDVSTVNDMLDKWYVQNDVRDTATLVNKYGLIYGDAYGLVWPDEDGKPELWVQNPSMFAVLYDDTEAIQMAVKTWIEPVADDRIANKTITRVNVYDADSVRRYTSLSGVCADESLMTPYAGDGYPAEQPNPFGEVPVVHFGLGVEPWDYAHSDLEDVLSLQDKLNSTGQDAFLVTRQQAFPQRYMIGLDAIYNPDTGLLEHDFVAGADQVWMIPEGVQVGQLAAAEMKQLLDTMEDIRMEICRVSSTPAHLLTVGASSFPSGEALKTAEAPLLDAVEMIQQKWERPWKQIARLACKCWGVDTGSITVKWQDVTPHSDKEQAETATLKSALGWSNAQIQRDMGLDEAAIKKMAVEKAEDQAANVNSIASAFNGGTNV